MLKKKLNRVICIVIVVAILLALFFILPSLKESEKEVNTLEDISGAAVGVVSGSIMDTVAEKYIPGCKVAYYNNSIDLGLALNEGKIDAYVTDEPLARRVMNTYPNQKIIDYLTNDNYAYILPKNNDKAAAISKELNIFIRTLRQSGELADLATKWCGTNEDEKIIDFSKVQSGVNGILTFATSTDAGDPFSFMKNSEIIGYDIEIAVKFCEKYGYGLKVDNYSFSTMLNAVQSGMADFAGACITVTEERKESVLFSEYTYQGGVVAVINSSAEKQKVFTSVDELEGEPIGVLSGSMFDKIAASKLKSPDICYYNNQADLPKALQIGKVSAFIVDEPVAKLMTNEYKSQTVLTKLTNEKYGIFFKKDDVKGTELCIQMNEMLAVMRQDGSLEKLREKWISGNDEEQVIDFNSVKDGPNGVLVYATSSEVGAPFCYLKEGVVVGYEVELAVEFCKKYGYGIRVDDYTPSGMFASVPNGQADFAGACVAITDERKETMQFADSHYDGGAVLVVKSDTRNIVNSLEDLNGGDIGVLTGSIFDKIATENIENCNLFYFNNQSDLPNALNNTKIAAYLVDEPVAKLMLTEHPNQKVLTRLTNDEYSFAFKKNDEEGMLLCVQMNEFLKKISDDGTIDSIADKWINGDESKHYLDYDSVKNGVNGNLVLGTSTEVGAPFSYMENGNIVGYDIDIAIQFCKEYGYGLVISDYAFAGLIDSVVAGNTDFAACGIIATDERKESVLMSDPNYVGGVVAVVLNSTDTGEDTSFFASIAESFNKTFIRENRWKLFLKGIGVTMLITVLSIIFGFVMGFCMYLLCRRGSAAINLIAKFCFRVVQGIPMVVFLMILYYIVLGKTELGGIWVSVIAFSITFAAATFGILNAGVGAIPKEQYEAAFALGFSDRKAFVKIIFPQALMHVIQLFGAEVVTHIKATAIVGYIAVADLTKMSDIVRSRTYEAFFPLIVTAIIYFVLEAILIFVVKRIEINNDNKKRKPETILKGIKTK